MKLKKLVYALLIVLLMSGFMSNSVFDFGYLSKVEAASKIKMSKSKATLYVGNTVKLKLKGAKTKRVKWSSSKKSVASVSKNGKVKALKKGTTYIYAKCNNKKYKCKVKVKSAKISETQLSLRVGQGYALSVEDTSAKVKWKSSDTTVAVVNSNGYISPVAKGVTTISAAVGGEIYRCQLNVVPEFTEEDFVFDTPTDEGYTNYIDFSTGKGSSWYFYWKSATSTKGNKNRGLGVGDTFEQFIYAYGQCDIETVSAYDDYKEHFSNYAYPRTKATLSYKDNLTQKTYYKSFYFDRNGTLVLIVWHR